MISVDFSNILYNNKIIKITQNIAKKNSRRTKRIALKFELIII